MKQDGGILRLSATDLANHLACGHLTGLDRGKAEGRWKPPDFYRPEAEVLRERGFEHERAYLAHLEREGHTITRLDDGDDGRGALEKTVAAMYAGADVIAQATLADGRWFGRADVLLRVDHPSGLGAWSYEALDTKLARETKAGAILQLCLYSEMIGRIQGVRPEFMRVVPRRPDFPVEIYRFAEYAAYYRLVRRRLEAAVDAAGELTTYPEPVPHCDICRWFPRCDKQRRADDHLSLVAGLSRLQTRELESREVETLAGLATVPLPIPWKPKRGAREAYARVREQARVQLEGRTAGRTLHELLLPVERGRGLAALPSPSPGDLFMDLEGDPYVDDGGIEFVFGWAVADPPPPGQLALERGEPVYHARWALDRPAERRGFEEMIDTIMARLATDPNMHVYHFGAYEPGAVKRLMGRYATRESEVDRLLRGERFVDLHAVVRQALRASVEQYSIKQLEPLFGFERAQDLKLASASLRVIQRGLELGAAVRDDDDHAQIVEAYNRDDCLSTHALRDWLEARRAEVEASGIEIERPPMEREDPSEKVGDRERAARALMERLLADVPEDDRTPEQHARWLLAHLLEWHRREDKSAWWDYFRLRDLDDEALLDETAGLSGLTWVERVPATGRSVVDRYRFPAQETAVRGEDTLHTTGPDSKGFGEVVAIDLNACTVDIKKSGAAAVVHPTGLFAHKVVGAVAQADALMRLGAWVAERGVDAPGAYRAARDLLLRTSPRVPRQADGALEMEGEGGVKAARRLALALDRGTLAIQGPPGSGKTYTGARMILDLVRAGKRVGICAHSHKVIRNLLDAVVRAAEAERRPPVACMQKVKEKSDPPDPRIAESTDNAAVRAALRDGRARVVGGTSWMWAREEFFEAVDVLFVDEAGQLSLANVLAVAQGASSVVLLGDPRQLEQPIQGSHPDGTAVSALEHVLGDHQTIPREHGLFLAESWRLPPEICGFTSELFYEGRLHARSAEGVQVLRGPEFEGAGFWYLPVEHDANQSASPEEVAAVVELVDALRSGGYRWRDRDGVEHPLALEHILVIAPYNAQVSDLAAKLPPGTRVGTVDRFQGQEAPVVIYSLTSSTPQDAPRGMDFLFDSNRFNVATSRAMCACIVVGSPRLFEPDCQTPKQMQLANAFCRLFEVARAIRTPLPR